MSEYCMNCAAMSRERDLWKARYKEMQEAVNSLFEAISAVAKAKK